jgi:hypothetical protein
MFLFTKDGAIWTLVIWIILIHNEINSISDELKYIKYAYIHEFIIILISENVSFG